MPEPIRYRVSMRRPHTHLFEVEAHFPSGHDALTVALPVWTPGSYLVREYARHVQGMHAVDAKGAALPMRRLDKRSYQVDAGGKAFSLRYQVYANELTVRTSHLDGSHGYFNGATLFFYSEALRNVPHHVEVEEPAGWTAFCALDRQGAAFVASDYDELVDSPFEVGPHQPFEFQAAGVPHQVVFWGDITFDAEKLVEEMRKVCETEAQLFSGLPMKRYLFLVYLTDKGRGGLEHLASTSLLFPRGGLSNAKGREDFLTLVAHEYFHLWNVKRIKPKALVPFDYSQECYTGQLWAFEGGTSYYDNLLVRRAGLMTPGRYLVRLGETLSALQSTPGRKFQSVEEASQVAWIKHYRPDENSPNSAISYYLKGEVVMALLDLEIRRATSDRKSLDDVYRLLWERYGDGRGVPDGGIEAAAEVVAGTSLDPFFERAVRSTQELDYGAFAYVGLEAKTRERESPTDRGGSPPRVKGADVRPRGHLGVAPRGSSSLGVVYEGSPAMEAGLYYDDEVVALDGFKVDAAGLLSRCEDKRPGDQVRVTVFRRDKLLEVPVTLGTKPADAVYLARVDAPSAAQKAAYQAWLGAPWEDESGNDPRA